MFHPSLRTRSYAAALRDLASEKAAVRAAAARDMLSSGREHPREAADALAPLLDDADTAVRVAALVALGALDAHHHVDAIAARVDDDHGEVRQHAVMALGDLGGDRAREHLERALGAGFAEVRFQALVAMAHVDPPRGLALAREALGDEDRYIAAEAALLVGALLTRDATRRHFTAAHAAEALTALTALDAHPNDELRVGAWVSRVRLGDAAPLDALFALAAGRLAGVSVSADLALDVIDTFGDLDVAHHARVRAVLGPIARRWFQSETRERARAVIARLAERPSP